MDGARVVDVVAERIVIPRCLGMSTVYPHGCCTTPDTEEWRALRREIERVCKDALMVAGAPF